MKELTYVFLLPAMLVCYETYISPRGTKSSRIFVKFTTKINEQIKYVLSYTLFKSKTINQLVSVDFNPEA